MTRLWIMVAEVMIGFLLIVYLYGCDQTRFVYARQWEDVQQTQPDLPQVDEADDFVFGPNKHWAESEKLPHPETKPVEKPEPESGEYVTGVSMNAGCVTNPLEMAVPKKHLPEAICEHITMIATRSDAGDFYEVAASFIWKVADPNVIALDCLFGQHENFCVAFGQLDVFDLDSEPEPRTQVTACVTNVCPQPVPNDCQETICGSVDVVSVVNLEGTWSFSGITFNEELTRDLIQDGRQFFDIDFDEIKDGAIDGKFVTFEIDDYLYRAELQDRDYLEGVILDQLGDQVIGNFSAERLL